MQKKLIAKLPSKLVVMGIWPRAIKLVTISTGDRMNSRKALQFIREHGDLTPICSTQQEDDRLSIFLAPGCVFVLFHEHAGECTAQVSWLDGGYPPMSAEFPNDLIG
ncbi:hypothetical protein ACS8E6_03580 [Salinicola halophyticus]|uniref:hypothetical protein n=1 Tax=Salinicola halophyticus TaxID=1808881 RepID=UPI003F44C910